MRRNLVVPGLVALAVLSGCATNPVTGRSQLALVSESTAISEANSQYNNMMNSLRAAGQLSEDPAQVDRVRGITDKIVAQAIVFRPDTQNWAWEVQVVADPTEFNAFCMAGGKMAIYAGLLEGLQLNDDEVAQVMAHEVAHALLGHSAEKMSVGILAAVLEVAAAATGATAMDQDLRQFGADLATDVFMELPNSRGTEAESDRVGIELAARAGFDPRAATTLWQKMIDSGHAGTGRADWLSTHPATPKRIETVTAMSDGLMPTYLAARDVSATQEQFRLAAQGTGAVSSGSATMSLTDLCQSPSLVDRAECLGRIKLGMTKDDIARELGRPNSMNAVGTELRYSDRFLQFDTSNRLIGISDRPQIH
jgi:predicted Zn-dependent protease